MLAGAVAGALLAMISAAAAATVYVFPDVAEHWALRPIAQLRAAGTLRGSGGSFRPDQPATRAEVVRLLVAVAGAEEAARELQGAPSTFADVSAGHWAGGAIEAAAERDLVRGFEDGTMRPERTLTRAELSVLLARALGWSARGQALPADPDAILQKTFTDAAEIPAWARDAVAAAAAGGWLVGDDRGRFRPADSVSRAEVAAVIARVARSRGLFDLRGAWGGWDAQKRSASIDGRAWPLASDAVVFGGARLTDPALIREGEWVQAITDPAGRLLYVETVPDEWVGWLSGRDGSPSRLVVLLPPEGFSLPPAQPSLPQLVPPPATGASRQQGWALRTVEVSRDATVFRAGRPEPIEALRAGDRLYLRLNRATGRARVVDAVAVDLQGQVRGVEIEGRQLVHANPGADFSRSRIAASVRIFIDGVPAQLAAVRPGDRFVASTSDAGEIVYLEVRR